MAGSEHESSIHDVEQLTQQVRISKQELAYALGIEPETMAQLDYVHSSRLQQAMAILSRVGPWEGSTSAAWCWYRCQPIPTLGGLTASQLVSSDRGSEVLAYLAAVAEGGYS